MRSKFENDAPRLVLNRIRLEMLRNHCVRTAQRVDGRRSVWSCSTTLSNRAESLISPNRLGNTAENSVTMYAISKNVPQSIVAQLRAEFPPKSIGCLAEILPLSLLESTPPLPYSLSVATYTPPAGSTTTAIEFRSTLAGRPNVTVGREIKAGPRLEDFGADIGVGETIDTGFEKFLKGEKWGFGEAPGMGRRAQIPELASLEYAHSRYVVVMAERRLCDFRTDEFLDIVVPTLSNSSSSSPPIARNLS